MGVQTEETAQPAVMRGPVPMAQPLGAFTGPAMAPTLVDQPVSDDFMRRLVKQESGGNPNAVSPKGATGLTQVMPSTAVDPGYGVPSIFDLADEQGIDYSARTQDEAARLLFNPDLNYQFGNLYANAMSKRFGGDPALTAAAYNAGPGAVEQYGGVPPFPETLNYVDAVVGGGGDSRLGGGTGDDTLGVGNGSVEGLLAQLYPQMTPEEEKRQRRNDFFSAASQGLTALGQGRPVDFSNIRADQENRKRQAVLDMRERERARSAATLVLEQGGSPAMATALATGAASMGDFLTDRQIARAEKEADRQKLLAATKMDLLAPTLVELGIPEDRIAEIVAYGKEGGDVTEILTQNQAVAAAEKLREQEADQLELAQSYLNSDDPLQQTIGQLMRGGLSLKDAIDSATKMLPKDVEAPTAVRLYNDAYQREVVEGGMSDADFRKKYGASALESEMTTASRTGTGLGLAEDGRLGISGETAAPPLPEESPATSVFSVAPSTTGAVASLQKFGANTLGQVSELAGFGPIAQDVVAAQQRFSAWRTNAINALKTNERVLAQELALITQELAPESGALQSPATLQTKLVEIDSTLRRRLQSELARANDSSIPVKDRQEARKIADDINYVLQTLHEPAAAAPQAAPVEETPVEAVPVGEVVETVLPAGTVILDADGNERPLAAGEQPKPGDTVRLPDGTVGVIE
jgi:hypothetical protein